MAGNGTKKPRQYKSYQQQFLSGLKEGQGDFSLRHSEQGDSLGL